MSGELDDHRHGLGGAAIERMFQATDFNRPVHCLLGLPFDALTLTEAVSLLRTAASGRRRCFVSTPNLNFVVACLTDAAFRQSVLVSNVSVADGMPLVWAARLLRIPIPERVAGSTLFETLAAPVAGRDAKPLAVYFFGGPEGIAERACARLNERVAASAVCVGHASPGFGTVDDMSSPKCIASVNASGADFVVVSLGAKKGQAWIMKNLDLLDAPLACHLGAVVNFLAGSVQRAPERWQRMGLEWLWRVREEPALWRRYLNDGLALMRLFFTRVLPATIASRLWKPDAAAVATASVAYVTERDCCTIELPGAWTARNIEPVRDVLTAVTSRRSKVVLDFTGTTFVDSACLGLFLLLKGHQERNQLGLETINVPARIRRTARWGCAEYLFDRTA